MKSSWIPWKIYEFQEPFLQENHDDTKQKL